MEKIKNVGLIVILCISCLMSSCKETQLETTIEGKKNPIDYVNPYIGNISHLLVPTYPTVHLPNSMLRVCPERAEYTSDQISGLPMAITSHRGSSAFNISLFNTPDKLCPIKLYTYDKEIVKPYFYSVSLDEENIDVAYAPSHRSAVYSFNFNKDKGNVVVINTGNGKLEFTDGGIAGYQIIDKGPTIIYLYLEVQQKIKRKGVVANNSMDETLSFVEGHNKALVLVFNNKEVKLRYGISFISVEQARNNLINEIDNYSVDFTANAGRQIWNDALNKIEVEGGSVDDKALFYTSLYRVYERMINISEDGRYYSAFDNKIHDDNGTPFYTDDWVWDTYRAAHPLRVLIDADVEQYMINSYIRMAQQTKEGWMPTFPEITGDSHRMNGNHAVAIVWDAYAKGLRRFDLKAAYEACKGALTKKSLLPWTKVPNTELDLFYQEKGYFPALRVGQEEYIKEVVKGEKRQAVAVTLGTCYDDWCLSQVALELGKKEEYDFFLNRSYNYRSLYNPQTGFFHPKDTAGNFISPFDYRFSGGQGARNYYDENNGWIYRWDVPHNLEDLINLMGSKDNLDRKLDQTYREPLGKSKFDFYAQLPDHTGNVGQFSMANEPSLHIPYIYNYVGKPWKTQKRIRTLIKQWFRNDLMGIPGDEDGGGLSAFVVFSSMGFYPVTPGMPIYNIGSPLFTKVKMKLSSGHVFEIEALNCSLQNKYIQSAILNGKIWDRPWFTHSDIVNGGKLTLMMGDKPNRAWGAAPQNAPPSAEGIRRNVFKYKKMDKSNE